MPRARRVLSTRPLQHFQVPFPRRIVANVLITRARGVLLARPLQHFHMPSFRRTRTSILSPRARRVLCSQPLQNVQVPSQRRQRTSGGTPRARRVQTSQKLQSIEMPFPGCPFTCLLIELVAPSPQVLKSLNGAAKTRPPWGPNVIVQLVPHLHHQSPQDLDAVL